MLKAATELQSVPPLQRRRFSSSPLSALLPVSVSLDPDPPSSSEVSSVQVESVRATCDLQTCLESSPSCPRRWSPCFSLRECSAQAMPKTIMNSTDPAIPMSTVWLMPKMVAPSEPKVEFEPDEEVAGADAPAEPALVVADPPDPVPESGLVVAVGTPVCGSRSQRLRVRFEANAELTCCASPNSLGSPNRG